MRTAPLLLLATATAFAAAGLLLTASAGDAPAQEPAASADLLPSAQQRRLSLTASQLALRGKAAEVSVDDVGDVESFRRNVTWLGVAQMNLDLREKCPKPDPASNAACVPLLPAPATTAFDVQDVARIKLPPKATHSILCHWFSPVLMVNYRNPTGAAAIAQLAYTPTLTVENPVLDDPALIDPTTGLPFGGRLTAGMTASELFQVPLAAGAALDARERDTATCIGGFVTRKSLVGVWGLSEAQADAFFGKETTVRMNVRGTARYVGNASLVFGLRIVGD
ncbi:MAG: hypothetical protein LCH70_05175 [Proteobacteria bacterium]|nr:hypothetical protein [Pseudomonadota bacterium]